MRIIKKIHGQENDEEYFKLLLAAKGSNVVEMLVGKFYVSKDGLFSKLNLSNFSEMKLHTFTCISTQIGCPNRCRFCSNRNKEFLRNLSLEELKQEIETAQTLSQDFFKKTLGEIQFGGIGEPLFNLDNIINTIEILHKKDPKIFFLIPTTGLLIQNFGHLIDILSRRNLPVYLQLSLHASNDLVRKEVMGLNNIASIMQLLKKYAVKVKSPIIINYLMIQGINDHLSFADEINSLLLKYSLKNQTVVKLSVPNYTNSKYSRPADDIRIREFKERLQASGTNVVIFKSGGKSVYAGCGQLTASFQKIKN